MQIIFFFSSRSRHTGLRRSWSSDVCSTDLSDDVRRQGEVRAGARGRQAGDRLGALVEDVAAVADVDIGLLPGHLEIVRALLQHLSDVVRSEERSVSKECSSRCAP